MYSLVNTLTAIRNDNARLDISANGFWGGNTERAMFDVSIFNTFAPSNRLTKLSAAIRDDNARLDISANGFWRGNTERAMFDVSIFNAFAPSNRLTKLSATYKKHEKEKKRAYGQRVRDVHGVCFFFSSCSFMVVCMGREATCVHKRLSSQLATKWQQTLFQNSILG